MSVKLNQFKVSVNWEYVIHSTFVWSIRWLCAGFAVLGIQALLGETTTGRVLGIALGFYLITLVAETGLGAFFQDDNTPVPTSWLGRVLRKTLGVQPSPKETV